MNSTDLKYSKIRTLLRNERRLLLIPFSVHTLHKLILLLALFDSGESERETMDARVSARCVCFEKRDCHLKELLQHAFDLGRGSQRTNQKAQAQHRALERYIPRYRDVEDSLESYVKIESSAVYDGDKEKLFVWPWMGIVANIPTQVKDGRRVGESGSKLRTFLEHEKATQQLLAKKEELNQREKKLQQREVQNENERSKLLLEPKMMEKEKLYKKIIELENKLDAKQALELETECMKSALQVMKHLGEEGDLDVKNKIDTVRQELKEKEEELNGLEELNQALIIKEHKSNDELQEARKDLFSVST
ncbi:unnamed protein product [Dovyalis caffra]|uniref:Uncharacterized protein n=1 Tax=Dovyalis caffra TaxID=77055 RepID=A0AAV1RC76_9ROSI|nr:unnamed protein product [Dovyalis caffra]